MSKRLRFYVAGWGVVLVLLVVNQWHRAPSGSETHLHTQFGSVAIFALLVVLSVWGGLMLHHHFDGRVTREDPL